MGSVGKKFHPKRGSLAYSPRKKAPSQIPRLNSWRKTDSVRLLDFPGYKAGMTHVLAIDDRPTTLSSGKEIFMPVTVVETPPVYVLGIRGYKKSGLAWRAAGEKWATPKKNAERTIVLPKKEKVGSDLTGMHDVRVIVMTQPVRLGFKKKPEIMEIGIGGKDAKEKLAYAEGILGKEVKAEDVFKAGGFVDVISITKGKGTQGVIKRWGVKLQDRKTDDAQRHVGCIGPWKPHRVMWTVPFSGQMGYQKRTAMNRRILRILDREKEDITPKGGFLKYGILHSTYLLIKGSIGGPAKRLVRIREAIRPPNPKHLPAGVPEFTYISKASKQGV
jgi:large subunit ribosomal protein L3